MGRRIFDHLRRRQHKETPILVADGRFDANRVSDRFAGASAQMPPEIVGFVDTKLRQHPDYVPRAETNHEARVIGATPPDTHEAPPNTRGGVLEACRWRHIHAR